MLRWDIEDFTSFPIWGVVQTLCSCQTLLLALYCAGVLMSQPLQSFGVGKSSLPPPRQVGVYFHSFGQPGSLTPHSPPHSLCTACVASFLQVLFLQEFPIYLFAFDNFVQYKPPWNVLTLWCKCNRRSSMPPLGFGIIFSQLKTWEGGPVSPQTTSYGCAPRSYWSTGVRERFTLEGTAGTHLVQLPAQAGSPRPHYWGLCPGGFDISREGGSRASLSQRSVTLPVQKFFLMHRGRCSKKQSTFPCTVDIFQTQVRSPQLRWSWCSAVLGDAFLHFYLPVAEISPRTTALTKCCKIKYIAHVFFHMWNSADCCRSQGLLNLDQVLAFLPCPMPANPINLHSWEKQKCPQEPGRS